MNSKHYLDIDVYAMAMKRIEYIFEHFKTITIAFSGGKDSGVMLNLVVDYCNTHDVADHNIYVSFLDYEVQYTETIKYVERTLSSLPEYFHVLHICMPFCVSTTTSSYEDIWRPWDPNKEELWVRKLPKDSVNINNHHFDFWDSSMIDYQFQDKLNTWVGNQHNDKHSITLIGIRASESMVRYMRTITKNRKENVNYVLEMTGGYYQGFPIYDWNVEDVWIANGKFAWDYNKIYDLYYEAGLSVNQMRVASPFVSYGHADLELYKAIEPDLWAKMLGRVDGVNFAGIYGNTSLMGWKNLKLPEGHTWKSYLKFLLDTLPEKTSKKYQKMFKTSEDFWKDKGGTLEDETIQQLQSNGYDIELTDSPYQTDKKAVRFNEYPDDMTINNFRAIPSYKRMVVTILRGDTVGTYMGFSRTKEQMEKRKKAMEKYKNIF